jgi:hypothetical protein
MAWREKLHGAKDRSLSLAVRKAADLWMRRKGYGEVVDFSLDSRHRTIEATFLPEGEREPVTVRIAPYRLIEREGRLYLAASCIHASRPWLERILQDMVHGREVEVPPPIAAILRKVM